MAKEPITEPSGDVAEYTVVARRYRPQQLNELVGQEPVAQALSNALKTNRVAHAYLFTGARGVGKTSAARILAKALNCVNGPTPTPCDQCEICRSITAGEDIDVLEIDGASNRGIDEIRTIRQNVHTRPTRSRYKVYIIDEVHMLTRESFNALLKTLEEPPAHVKFIFATTEVQKIPVTILSRCQRFDFASIGTNRIVDRLRQIVLQEGMQADDDALQMVARRAGGSMRDGQSLLDQLLAFGSDRLTAEQVHHLLGTASDDRVMALAAAVLRHDVAGALAQLTACADEGLQLGELLDQLIDYWRSLMLVSASGGDVAGLHVTTAQRQILVQQVQTLGLDTILAGLDILTTTKSRLRTSQHAQVLIEMALIRLGRLEELLSVTQLVQLLANPNADLSHAAQLLGGQRQALGTAGEVKKKPSLLEIASRQASQTLVKQAVVSTVAIPAKLEQPSEFWPVVLSKIGSIVAAQLEKGTLPAILGPKALVVRFPPRYNLDYEYCRDATIIQRIEACIKEVTQVDWTIRMEIDATAMSLSAPVDANTPKQSAQDQKREVLQLPLLQHVMDRLGASLLRVDPGFGAEVPTTVNDLDDDLDEGTLPAAPEES